MYEHFFGLREPPFSIAPNPRYLYMSHQHHEALAHLIFGVRQNGGFVLLTGEVGTGKTTVCRCFLEQLPGNCNVAFILNPKLTKVELLETICDEYDIEYNHVRGSIKGYLDIINTHLLETHAKGHKCVLIIDEAQNLSIEVLEQIRLLTNLETNQQKLLQIILLGQPELKDIFAKVEMRQLAQRITARYHLNHLSFRETRQYVRHRLEIAGCRQEVFPWDVVKRLYKYSSGIPRLLNILCDRAMLGAYVSSQHQVDMKIFKRAAYEVFGTRTIAGRNPWVEGKLRMRTKLIAASCLILCSTFIFYMGQYSAINGPGLAGGGGREELGLDLPKRQALAKQEPKYQYHRELNEQHLLLDNQNQKGQTGVFRTFERDYKTYTKSEPKVQTQDRFSLEKTPVPAQSVKKMLEVSHERWQDSNKPVAKAKVPIKTDVLNWPDRLPGVQSKRYAYAHLFNVWSIPFDPVRTLQPPCEYAKKFGIYCLQRVDSFDELRHLNRPAVLKLYESDGNVFYGALLAADLKKAVVSVGEKKIELTRFELDKQWKGGYSMLWKAPPAYDGSIVPGSMGPKVTWLSKMLGRVQKDPLLARGVSYFGNELERKVKIFQSQNSLEADGVVGPKTLIALNSVLGETVPVLNRPLRDILNQ